MKYKLDLEIVQITKDWQNDLPKWLIRASRPTCLRVLPVEALVGTHHFTQIEANHRMSDLQLFSFQNQLRLFLAHVHTPSSCAQGGEARVNNEFWILRTYAWVGTDASILPASVPITLYSSDLYGCEFQVLHLNNIESLSLNKLHTRIVNSCII
jgi:hypothetical protein